MKNKTRSFSGVSILVGLMLCAVLSQAQGRRSLLTTTRHSSSLGSQTEVNQSQPASSSYTYTLFEFPGTFYTYPAAMTAHSNGSKIEIVGGYGSVSLLAAGSFLLHVTTHKGVTTESYQAVNVPGAPEQLADGVNKAGQIVGEYLDNSGTYHGWEFSGGTYTTIDVPFSGATGTGAGGINDSGEIVGFWDGSGIAQHGFTLIGGTYSSFDYPGAIQTAANALNNKGDITGYWVDNSGVQHGFLLSGGNYSSIDPPGSVLTDVTGINDAGDTVGAFCPTAACISSGDGGQGFLLSNGTYTIFTIPGATVTGLTAINDKGWLLGGYIDVAGFVHGFIAVP